MHVRRHALLYDIERWRRFRLPLLVLGTACLAGVILAPVLHNGGSSGTSPLSFLGAGFYGLAFNFWLRVRYSYLAVEAEKGNLVVRRPGVTMRLPLSDVRRARVGRVSVIANRPERQRQLPRPQHRWLAEEALIVRLDIEATDLVKLRRVLGKSYVFESDLVAPVIDPHGLLRDIEEAMPRPEPTPQGPRRRRRR
jgi:hypothetical protein